jgi:hypothetical protein
MSNNSPIFLDLEKHDVDKRLIEFLMNYSRDKKQILRHKFTSELHYRVFQHIPYYLDRVVVSRSYVVLCFHKTWKIEKRYIEREMTLRSYYIIGVNSDGKLFINKLDASPYEGVEIGCLKLKNGKDVTVYLTDDRDVYSTLGYDYDLETSSIKSIPVYMSDSDIYRDYRIQGDLVMTVESINKPYNDYINAVKRSIDNQVNGTLIRIILERIANILNYYGFTVDINGNSIAFECLSRSLGYEKTKGAIDKICKLIYKELYVKDIAEKLRVENLYGYGSTYSYGHREGWEITVDVFKGRGIFGNQYEPIQLNVYIASNVIEKFLDYIVKDLDVSKDYRTIYYGRHKIKYYGYPSRFTIISKLPLLDIDGMDNTFVFNVNLPVFYISEGLLEIEHLEHGIMKYNVMKDMLVSFRSTRVHSDNDARFNHYALETLKV